jgi:hypothetical protein
MTLKEKFKLGRKFLKEGNVSQADRMFDMCIVHISKETLNGTKEIDGVDINLL